jgi:magnesium-transporting ATPase (P-type)
MPREKLDRFWLESPDTLEARLDSGPAGLSGDEAKRRLALHGPNLLVTSRQRSALADFLRRFLNPLVLLLLVAGAIAAATGDVKSFAVIAGAVALSVTLDFIQEHRAGHAVERLRRSVAVRVQTLRDGQPRDVVATEVVPGDVVLLAAGDLGPADGCILETRDFCVNQALFRTGWFIESMATQVLVIFVIRTRQSPWKSRPHPWLTFAALAVVGVAALLPFTPLGPTFEFVRPPAAFYLVLAAMAVAYLVMVEVVKRWFYRRLASEPAR